MKKIIYTRSDGGLSVVHPAENARLDNETDAEFISRIVEKDVPPGALDVQIVDATSIPTDRTFRNAWKAGVGKVEHNLPKCLTLAQDAIRVARAPKLAALDVEFMRAVEIGDAAKQAQIAAQKQRLRDATADARLTNAQTPEALKAAMAAVIAGL